MANVNEIFPSNYIKASDLQGRAVKLTIIDIKQEKIGDDEKYVVYFNGKEKGLVLNKTNAQMIASKYGPETNEWAGAEIELYPDKTHFQGQLVDCLRVRYVIPAANTEDEGIPF